MLANFESVDVQVGLRMYLMQEAKQDAGMKTQRGNTRRVFLSNVGDVASLCRENEAANGN
jgi:hypothetical protein